MIISNDNRPDIAIFKSVMQATDILLNQDARSREGYYVTRGGKPLEEDVYRAVCQASQGTQFEGTIKLVSGASFPDIVADKYYGVEVKSTEKNHWTSTGSSILESTRSKSVDRIYLTFGKLGKPVEFISRPYEECLSGIAVTHYPRYKIDMQLRPGDTIFDKMGVPYETLRHMDNPVAPVSKYYTEHAKPGESLWWAQGESESTTSSATIRLWTSLNKKEKEELTAQGYALFPEVLGPTSNKKYNRYALWLASSQGVVNTNIRDSFSAGGQVSMRTLGNMFINMPSAFGRIRQYKDLIRSIINESPVDSLKQYWCVNYLRDNRLSQWCDLVVDNMANAYKMVAKNVLMAIFSEYKNDNLLDSFKYAGFAVAEESPRIKNEPSAAHDSGRLF